MNKECLLPDHGVFISPEGFVTSCCVSMHDRFGNVKNEHPITIFKNSIATKFRSDFSAGSLPYSCNICINHDNYQLRVEKTKVIQQAKIPDSGIVYADITLGNICQLSCVMCNEVFSHTWAKLVNKPEAIWYASKEKMNEILEMLVGVSYLEIKGGDPFNMPYFEDFLNKLYDINQDVSLLMLTSGVVISDNHLTKLQKFKNFNIGVSLEATGELYKYIRGGHHTIDDVFENLSRVNSYNLLDGFYFSSTLSFYNIDSWVKDHIEISNRFESMFGYKPRFSLNFVTAPEHQSVYLATTKVREQFYKDLLSSNLNIETQFFSHVVEDRIVNTSYNEIINKIAYYDSIRAVPLKIIKPNLMDNLSPVYRE